MCGATALWRFLERNGIPAVHLVFDVESDPPVRPCRFCGLPDSASRHYGHESRWSSLFQHYGSRLGARIPDPAKQPLKRLLRR